MLLDTLLADNVSCRLNTKVQARDVVVNDLVQDLSDGVNIRPCCGWYLTDISHTDDVTGDSNPSSRSLGQRIAWPVCLEA